jgi:phage-related protein
VNKAIPPLQIKPLEWVGRSKEELKEFPEAVIRFMGHALFEAQSGGKSDNAKPLREYSGAGVLEIVKDNDGDTYRAVYTVRLADVVYVLHCFQKKSKKGIETPKAVTDLIRRRLKAAEEMHRTGKRSIKI